MIRSYIKIMTNREKFIQEIQKQLEVNPYFLSEAATAYFEELSKGKASMGGMTESGEKVLTWMLENEKTHSNMFSAKTIGEGLFTSSRMVSGAMRKLVTDGYVEKTGQNPVSYSLTDTARSWKN